ncbi:hypothetical protein A2U01_0065072, partial [Trifolium medium]|nr:hypothetical protein [Trifolium medium]
VSLYIDPSQPNGRVRLSWWNGHARPGRAEKIMARNDKYTALLDPRDTRR